MARCVYIPDRHYKKLEDLVGIDAIEALVTLLVKQYLEQTKIDPE